MQTTNAFGLDIFSIILDFVQFPDLKIISCVSSEWNDMISEYKQQKSYIYLSKLKDVKEVNNILDKKLEKTNVKSLRVHEYKVLNVKNYDYENDEELIVLLVHLHFTCFHKNRQHEIKIYEDLSDKGSGVGCSILYASYGIPGFNSMFKDIKFERYCFGWKTEIIGDLSNLQKWMGFSDQKEFHWTLNEIISVSNENIEHLSTKKHLMTSKFCNYINDEEKNKQLPKYREESFKWINEWADEIEPFESFKIDEESDISKDCAYSENFQEVFDFFIHKKKISSKSLNSQMNNSDYSRRIKKIYAHFEKEVLDYGNPLRIIDFIVMKYDFEVIFLMDKNKLIEESIEIQKKNEKNLQKLSSLTKWLPEYMHHFDPIQLEMMIKYPEYREKILFDLKVDQESFSNNNYKKIQRLRT
jgi:hypothetical protein